MRQARHRLSGSVRQRMCPHRRVYAPSPRMFCDAGHPDAHDLDNGLIRGMTHPIGRITSLPNTCARWPPTPPPEGAGRRTARDMYSANMVSTLVRAHPCPHSPCVSHRVPSFGTNGVALAAAYLEGRAGKQSGPGRANQSASLPIASTRGREEESRATCIPPTWFPRWSAGILARSLLVCPIAFPQFRRMGWPFSGVSIGTIGQA